MPPYRPSGGANIKLLYDVKLWSRTDIPTEIEYKVLCHLVDDPDARVYLDKYADYGAGVTNSKHAPGWTTRGGVFKLRHGCHMDRRPWVAYDPHAPRKQGGDLKPYRLTKAGREAIAQYRARNRYEKEHLDLARQILAQERTILSACNDN